MTKIPTLSLFGAIFYWIPHGHGRPQSHAIYRRETNEEIIKRVSEEANKHLISEEDFKKLNLPPIPENNKELNNEIPHHFNFINDGFGNYNFSVNTLLLKRSEVGGVKNSGTDNEILIVKGQFEIKTIMEKKVLLIRTIGYIADENGFRSFLINIRFAFSSPLLPYSGKSELSSAYQQETYDELIKGVIEEANSYFGFKKDIERLDLPVIENSQKLQNKNPHYFSLANNGSGNYYFSVNTFSLKRSELGELKNLGNENEILIVKGQYEIRTKIKTDLLIIRNIGYIVDEGGLRSFLISVKFASSGHFSPPTRRPIINETETYPDDSEVLDDSEILEYSGDSDDSYDSESSGDSDDSNDSDITFYSLTETLSDKEEKKGISSACLASLCGGNVG